MKLDAVLALIKPFLATDAKPETIKAAILAADKGAKDAEADKVAKDKKAGWDKARDAMSDEDKKAFDAMSDEDKDKACAKDENLDPEGTDEDVDGMDNDLSQAESGTPSKGGANKAPAKDKEPKGMDAATVEQIVARAVAGRDALHTAQLEVAPIVGVRAFDKASDAYKAGLEALGVDVTGIPAAAFPAMLKLAKDRQPKAPVIANDEAQSAEIAKLIPNLNRLR